MVEHQNVLSTTTMSPISNSQHSSGPVYQINYSNELLGKQFRASKRCVKWTFGFSHKKALESFETGANCRGEEHEIKYIWSSASGKRIVYVDDKEIHYSASPLKNRFEFNWSMKGKHEIKLICYARAHMLSKCRGTRKYELIINGLSFFDCAKIFELGITEIGGSLRPSLPMRLSFCYDDDDDDDDDNDKAHRKTSIEGSTLSGDSASIGALTLQTHIHYHFETEF